MITEHIQDNILYTLSNENLKVGDKTYPISFGKVEGADYIHSDFDYGESVSGFPKYPHIILDLNYSKDKVYEVQTDRGFGSKEIYFKIIETKVISIWGTLKDKGDSANSGKQVKCKVAIENDSICIYPEGYGDAVTENGNGCPIMIEVYNNELRVILWSDINGEDPTHIIGLENAKENLRERYLTYIE